MIPSGGVYRNREVRNVRYIQAMRNNGWVDLENLPTNEIIAQAGLKLDTDVKTVGERLLTASFTGQYRLASDLL